MQIMLNIPDEFPQEMVNKILKQFERQIQIEENLFKTAYSNISNANDVTVEERDDKLMALRSALIEGENSGIAKGYSLQGLLAELDNGNFE